MTTQTTITLPPELESRAVERAKERGVSLGQLVCDLLEAHLRDSGSPSRRDNPFFRDTRVFTGDVPPDLSLNHDEYLYGERE